MNYIEFVWNDEPTTLKGLLQGLFHSSGQLLKRHYSSKELARSVGTKDLVRVPLDLANHLQINPVFKGPRPRILKETSDYLALHKPPGVHCHPLTYSDQDTLLNFLAEENRWAPLNVNQSHYDRGLLYRLDYETSGVVVLAKTESFFEKIRYGFETQMREKIYLAVVSGDFDREGAWVHYFRATGVKGAKQSVMDVAKTDAAEGILTVKKLAYENDRSLLQVSLQTGLRHQIRAQLAFLGFPIVGDELYGGRKAERLYLHAYRYQGAWGEVVDKDAEGFDFDNQT